MPLPSPAACRGFTAHRCEGRHFQPRLRGPCPSRSSSAICSKERDARQGRADRRLHPHDQDQAHGAPHGGRLQGAARRQPVARRHRARTRSSSARRARSTPPWASAAPTRCRSSTSKSHFARASCPRPPATTRCARPCARRIVRMGVSDAKQSGRVDGRDHEGEQGQVRAERPSSASSKKSWPHRADR